MLRPSWLCVVAATGQTDSQGAFSHCMHSTGWWTATASSGVAAEIAVDADPVHLAAVQHLLLADDGDVVLRLAGHDAGPAAGAGSQIDGHAPAVQIVRRHVALIARGRRRAVELVLVEDRHGGLVAVAFIGIGQRTSWTNSGIRSCTAFLPYNRRCDGPAPWPGGTSCPWVGPSRSASRELAVVRRV